MTKTTRIASLLSCAGYFFVALLLNPIMVNAQEAATSTTAIQFMQLGEYDSAVVSFTELIALQPDKKELYYNRGLAFYNLEKYDTALSDFNAALAMDTAFEDALYMKGLSLGELGELEQAIATMEKLQLQNKDYNNVTLCIKKYRLTVLVSRTWYYMIAMAIAVFIIIALATGILSAKKN